MSPPEHNLFLTQLLLFGFLVSLVASWTCPEPAGLHGLASHRVCLPALCQPRDSLEMLPSLCTPQGPEQLLQVSTDAVAGLSAGCGSKQTSCLGFSHTCKHFLSKTSHLRASFLPPWGDGKGLQL